MAMMFSDWTTAVGTLLEIPMPTPAVATPSSDANFNAIYPRAIEYAEQRIYRELDLLNTRVTDESAQLTANSRAFTLPTSGGTIFIVTEQVALIVGGNRQAPLLPVSREFLDGAYPADASASTPSYPLYWCPVDQVSILVGPSPDSAYFVSVVGTKRPNPLSAANSSTFLTQYLPDLFLAASMVFFAGYQRDFGAQADDPKLALSWEATYKTLFASAGTEELRKKFMANAWSARVPNPIATPPQV